MCVLYMYTDFVNILSNVVQRRCSTPKSYCASRSLQMFGAADEVQPSSTEEVQNIPLTSCRGQKKASGHPRAMMDN